MDQLRALLASLAQRAQPYARAGWRRFRALPGRWQLVSGVVALIVVAAVCSGVLGAFHHPAPAASPPVTQATVPAATATHTPSGPACLDAAVLGGSASLFLRSYQAVTSGTGTIDTYSGTIDGQAVRITGNFADSPAECFHYVSVGPAVSGATWTLAQATAIARTFLPSDAHAGSEKSVPDFGTEHVYTSATLAHAFTPDAFTDATSGASVPPGTFYLACQDQLDGQGCSLQLGE